MPYNLIENALKYAHQFYTEEKTSGFGINEPLTPTAIRGYQYLRIRQNLMKGCREAVKLLPSIRYQYDPEHYLPTDFETEEGVIKVLRSPAYSILVMATNDIFQYGKTTELMNAYNKLLTDIIGTY